MDRLDEKQKQLNFKLKSFEGPLYLLLHLIRKNKYSIYDVPITELLRQYLDYINEMQAQDMDVASEFLEMAAYLIYIKTCSLLPKKEEEEKLKEELTGRLLQLEAVQLAAKKLREVCVYGLTYTRLPQEIKISAEYSFRHTPDELLKGMNLLFIEQKRQAPPPESSFEPLVSKRNVSVTSRVIYILRRLYKNEKISYYDFFTCGEHSERVATFLAMLELVKSKRISFSKDDKYIIFQKR